MSLRVLCIGDPHFKRDNSLETDLMVTQLRKLILEQNYDFVVVLGDTFHTNEKLNLHIQKRVVAFFKMLKDTAKQVYVLVGNHDRPNNNVFMGDDHPFTSLKEWGDKIRVIDTTETFEIDGGTFVFVPYVPAGRFEEALMVNDHEAPYSGISCIFAHQEFKGCQMGAIKSEHGDEWHPTHPLCISGHIHDYAVLHNNMIYPGTPIQHNYSDREDKSISVFTFERKEEDVKDAKFVMVKQERVTLDIPRKLTIKLTPKELLEFTPPINTKVKIKVMAEASVLKSLMQTEHVANLKKAGVKIDVSITTHTQNTEVPVYKVKTSFQMRVLEAVHSNPTIKATFNHIFPNMAVNAIPAQP
jgi:DNA repair exonuclease SbcCD nuclease subunit